MEKEWTAIRSASTIFARVWQKKIQFSMQTRASNYWIFLRKRDFCAPAYRASLMDHQSRLFATENRQSTPFFPSRRRRCLPALGFPL